MFFSIISALFLPRFHLVVLKYLAVFPIDLYIDASAMMVSERCKTAIKECPNS